MSQSVLKIYTDHRSCVYIDGSFVSEIEEYSFLRIPLKKGVYELKIIPIDFSLFTDTRTYTMLENDIEDLIKIYFKDKIKKIKQTKYLDSRVNKQNCLELYNYKTGEILFTYLQSFTYIGEFNAEGLAPIMEGGSVCVDECGLNKAIGGVWGFINWDGSICIPAIYNDFDKYVFYNNCKVIVKKACLWGMIDQQNNIIVNFLYNALSYINSNLIITNNYLNKWGAIDSDENIIIDFIYDNYAQIWNCALGKNTHFILNFNGDLDYDENHEGINACMIGGESQIYDLTGKELSDTEFTYVDLMTDREGYLQVRDKRYDKPYKFLLVDCEAGSKVKGH